MPLIPQAMRRWKVVEQWLGEQSAQRRRDLERPRRKRFNQLPVVDFLTGRIKRIGRGFARVQDACSEFYTNYWKEVLFCPINEIPQGRERMVAELIWRLRNVRRRHRIYGHDVAWAERVVAEHEDDPEISTLQRRLSARWAGHRIRPEQLDLLMVVVQSGTLRQYLLTQAERSQLAWAEPFAWSATPRAFSPAVLRHCAMAVSQHTGGGPLALGGNIDLALNVYRASQTQASDEMADAPHDKQLAQPPFPVQGTAESVHDQLLGDPSISLALLQELHLALQSSEGAYFDYGGVTCMEHRFFASFRLVDVDDVESAKQVAADRKQAFTDARTRFDLLFHTREVRDRRNEPPHLALRVAIKKHHDMRFIDVDVPVDFWAHDDGLSPTGRVVDYLNVANSLEEVTLHYWLDGASRITSGLLDMVSDSQKVSKLIQDNSAVVAGVFALFTGQLLGLSFNAKATLYLTFALFCGVTFGPAIYYLLYGRWVGYDQTPFYAHSGVGLNQRVW